MNPTPQQERARLDSRLWSRVSNADLDVLAREIEGIRGAQLDHSSNERNQLRTLQGLLRGCMARIRAPEFEEGAYQRCEELLDRINNVLGPDEVCAVCLEEVSLGLWSDRPGRTLSCNHIFHDACLRRLPSLAVRGPCPDHGRLAAGEFERVWPSCAVCSRAFAITRWLKKCPLCRSDVWV